MGVLTVDSYYKLIREPPAMVRCQETLTLEVVIGV